MNSQDDISLDLKLKKTSLLYFASGWVFSSPTLLLQNIGIQELQLHEGISAPFHHPKKSSLQTLQQKDLECSSGQGPSIS